MNQTQEKILEVALELFNEKGFSNVTMREIAATADIAVGNVTYYYHQKSDMIPDLITDPVYLSRENSKTLADFFRLISEMLDTLIDKRFFFRNNDLLVYNKSFSKDYVFTQERVLLHLENNIAEFGLNFDDTLAHCVTDSVLLNEIKECVGSEFGNKIQHEMAQKTAKHSWVPWIVVDGVHDETVENAILTDMIGYLCSLPHANCNENYTLKYYNPITNNPFLIIDRCYADEMK
jgi:AcrR family transcriptional regulator